MVFLPTWMFWTKCLCPPLENHLGFPPWEHSWPLFRHLFLFKLYYEYLIHVPLDHWVTDECGFHCYFIVCHLGKYMIVFLGYLPCAPPNPHFILPFPIVSWRLPITNGANGLLCPLPSASEDTVKSGRWVRWQLFLPCYAVTLSCCSEQWLCSPQVQGFYWAVPSNSSLGSIKLSLPPITL